MADEIVAKLDELSKLHAKLARIETGLRRRGSGIRWERRLQKKIGDLEQARAELFRLEQEIQDVLFKELAELPKKLGFNSTEAFLSELRRTRRSEVSTLPDTYGFRSAKEFEKTFLQAIGRDEPDHFEVKPPTPTDSQLIVSVDDEIKSYFARHPERMYSLSPRKFEQLVADILEDMGFSCELTPATRDGGCDIYARVKTAVSNFLVFVECKRYTAARHVGIDIVQRVHGAASAAGAHKSMIVTTSFFTQPALKERQRLVHLMDFADYNVLTSWLKPYRPRRETKA